MRSRLKLLYDSTAKDLHEHGSYVFADSVTHALYNGPAIHGEIDSIPQMHFPPDSACAWMHAHPNGSQYRTGPSDGDMLYSSLRHLMGFLITKQYIFYMDENGRPRYTIHRAG